MSPCLDKNLLSVGQTVTNDREWRFNENGYTWLVRSTGEILAQGPARPVSDNSFIYILNSSDLLLPNEHLVMVHDMIGESPLMLWHSRFCHVGKQTILDLAKTSAVTGFSLTPSALKQKELPCTCCAGAKICRKPFSRPVFHDTTRPGEVVAVDLCGPMRVPTMTGQKYMLVIIDYFTNYGFLYFLRNKDQAADCIRECYNKEFRSRNYTIGVLYSDQGGEFSNKELTTWLTKNGIDQKFTAGYSPQQNGKVERLNRTIVELSTAILMAASMPMKWYADAAATVWYVLLRTKLVRNTGKTAYELWTGRKPDLKHLHAWGCFAIVRLDVDHPKFQPRGTPARFIGYSLNTKEYKFALLPHLMITVLSRDAVFDETTVQPGGYYYPNHLGEKSLSSGAELEYLQNNGILDSDEDGCGDNPETIASYKDPPVTPPKAKPHIPVTRSIKKKEVSFAGVSLEPCEINSILPTAVIKSSESICKAYFEEEPPTPDQKELTIFEHTRENEGTSTHSEEFMLKKLVNFPLHCSGEEPRNYHDAVNGADKDHWIRACNAEFESLVQHEVAEVVMSIPKGVRLMDTKCVFKVKKDKNGKVLKYKTRLTLRGFKQREHIDYDETFAGVPKATTFRYFFALTAIKGFTVHLMDVHTAFLHGDIDKDIYLEMPAGYGEYVQAPPESYLRLKKSLYGLKQAPRIWNELIAKFLINFGLVRSKLDTSLYYIKEDNNLVLMVLIHVDDLMISGSTLSHVQKLKDALNGRFKMEDNGEADYALGIHIDREKDGSITLHQRKYIDELLDRFNVDENPISTPADPAITLSAKMMAVTNEEKNYMKDKSLHALAGSLLYLALWTRPDILFAVCTLARYVAYAGPQHWTAGMRILRYLKGTRSLGLHYKAPLVNNPKIFLDAFSDASFSSIPENSKSVTSSVVRINHCVISFRCKGQSTVAMSTCEAEAAACVDAVKEVIFLRDLCEELGFPQVVPTPVYVDNEAAVAVAKNAVHHDRMKHTARMWNFLLDCVATKIVNTIWIPTKDQMADLGTKLFLRGPFECLRSMFNMKSAIQA